MLSLLIPFGTALTLSYVLTPLAIRGAHKAGILDVPVDERRAHSVPVPRLGGVAVFLAIWLTWLGQSLATSTIWNPFGPQFQDLTLALAIGSVFIFFVGILDDVRGVSPRIKLTFQACAALSVIAYGVAPDAIAIVPGTSVWHVGKLAGTSIFVFWMVGITNAFNLIDGLDGLAGSFALVASATLMLSIAVIQPGLSVAAPAIVAGATIGFLRYNWHPARVFLGDAGSMTLGFLLAVLTVVSATDADGVTYPIVPLLALAFPITDTFVAIARRWVRGVPFSLADGRHIHHQLRTAGLSVPETVRALSLAFCLIAGFGLTVIFAPPRYVMGILVAGVPLLILGTVYGMRWLRYDEFAELGSSITSLLRQARQIVRIKIYTNDAASRIKAANSIEDIQGILDSLAEQVGLIDIELVDPAKKDTTAPPSQQIARLDAHPMRLDYTVSWPSNSMNYRTTVRFWRGMDEDRHFHVVERVAMRIGPAVGAWLASRPVNSESYNSSNSHYSRTETRKTEEKQNLS